MLCLQRKNNEGIYLDFPNGCPPGTRIDLTVYQIIDKKARLGFIAPPECLILRKELETKEASAA